MTSVEARHVYKVFGKRPKEATQRLKSGADPQRLRAEMGVTPAVIDVSFSVDAGETFVVMGLSGSGKSTLIRTLNGLHPATAGEVLIHGEDIASMKPEQLRNTRRNHISMVFQHFALLPHRTILENAAYALEIRGVHEGERRDRATQALELVGLDGWSDRRPNELSGGMQQRVGLARALAADTDILLMDEAFSALDPLIRRDMQDQLVELQRTLHKTIVFITHDLNEAMRLGDRIAILREGRLVQLGTTDEILNSPADEYVSRFTADVDRSKVLTAASVMRPVATDSTTGTPIATTTPIAELLARAAHDERPIPVTDGDRIVGTVSRADLLSVLADERTTAGQEA